MVRLFTIIFFSILFIETKKVTLMQISISKKKRQYRKKKSNAKKLNDYNTINQENNGCDHEYGNNSKKCDEENN